MEREDPAEIIRQVLHHKAEPVNDRWISTVAVATAIIAVFAAICGLLAGHYSNEAILEQIRASDLWAYYQAKGVKLSVLTTKIETLEALGKQASSDDQEKARRYKEEQEEIKKEAEEKTGDSKLFFLKHETLSKGVTLFQIAIIMAAIAALTRKKTFFILSCIMGSAGMVFLVLGITRHHV
jgi:hypothetical protein